MTSRPRDPRDPASGELLDGIFLAALRVREAPVAAAAPRPITERIGVSSLAEALQDGRAIHDDDFDAVFPESIARLSEHNWTPVAVARRAAAMLVVDGSTRVLDVGAGPGKLCIVGALSTPGTFVGIERRPRFVRAARSAAAVLGARRAMFLCGDIRALDWRRFDAIYFFNPFVESYFGIDDRLDLDRSGRDLTFALSALRLARIGTRVVTYHGLGDDMPPEYERLASEPVGSDRVELWVKAYERSSV